MSRGNSIFTFALYGSLRGAEASVVGSTIFAFFYIIVPAIVLGLENNYAQYMFSRTIVIIIPALLFVGILGSIIPSVIGGYLLSVLLYSDVMKKEEMDIVVKIKGFAVGFAAGLFLWWLFSWKFKLDTILDIDRNLFIFYSIAGLLSTSIGGVWASVRLFKDGLKILKDTGR